MVEQCIKSLRSGLQFFKENPFTFQANYSIILSVGSRNVNNQIASKLDPPDRVRTSEAQPKGL